MDWLRRFMMGRYGVDKLSIALILVSFIFTFIFRSSQNSILSTLNLIIIFFAYFRVFSKNTYKRYSENQKFLKYWQPMENKIRAFTNRFKNRKNYKYLKCTNCKQKIRVPRGKGKIKIKCPKCGETMIKKT